jgi:hypothetical protein
VSSIALKIRWKTKSVRVFVMPKKRIRSKDFLVV